MKPLKSKYEFKLIDLFDSEKFENNEVFFMIMRPS